MIDKAADGGAVLRLKKALAPVARNESDSSTMTDKETESNSGGETSLKSMVTDTSGTGSPREGGAGGAKRIVDNLGASLPGVAVYPAMGDIYVGRGHAGLIRVVIDASGEILSQVQTTSLRCLFRAAFKLESIYKEEKENGGERTPFQNDMKKYCLSKPRDEHDISLILRAILLLLPSDPPYLHTPFSKNGPWLICPSRM